MSRADAVVDGPSARWEPDGTFTVRGHDRLSSFGVVDELFSSAADALGPELLAVVLTGAGATERPGHGSCGTRAAPW